MDTTPVSMDTTLVSVDTTPVSMDSTSVSTGTISPLCYSYFWYVNMVYTPWLDLIQPTN